MIQRCLSAGGAVQLAQQHDLETRVERFRISALRPHGVSTVPNAIIEFCMAPSGLQDCGPRSANPTSYACFAVLDICLGLAPRRNACFCRIGAVICYFRVS